MGAHDGHRSRLKEEFLARPETFPDHKVLELLLFYANPRGDTNPLAHELLERFCTLNGLLDAAPEEVQKVPGVGAHAAVLLRAVKELSCRYMAGSVNRMRLKKTRDACDLLRPYFAGATREMAYILCLDGQLRVLGIRKVSEGTINAAPMSARRLVEVALSLNASRVILAHNHVSGLATPSEGDVIATGRLKSILEQVEVLLIDHLIFADGDVVSMSASGSMDGFGFM